MATFETAWDFEALSSAVCDVLIKDGKLKEKPAFIRTDRQAKITKVFTTAGLDGAKMGTVNARGVEVLVRNATEGEAWVDDVQKALRGMLSEEAAASTTGPGESDEMKQVREKVMEAARTGAADGDPPPSAGGRRDRGERRSGDRGGDRDDAAYSSFGGNRSGGGGFGGGDRACYNCGEMGHISRDCPNARSGGGGRGGGRPDDADYGSFGGNRSGGGGFGGGDRACYNCGQMGHISRDCPEPRQGGGGGGGGACYNCGQTGHQARDCPEPRQDRY